MNNQFRSLLLTVAVFCFSAAPLRGQLVADGTTATINGFATNIAGNLIVGNAGSFTTLLVTNAGAVTNSSTGAIGETATARTNRVIVTGTNSIWHNASTLGIGRNGSFNELVVTNGGLVVNTFGNIGANSLGTNNRVVVTGTGSRWACTSTANVGSSGSHNTLLITNGGRVDSPAGVVGNVSIGNLALVTGNGSIWNCTSGLFVGQNVNSNQLIIEAGADVFSAGAYIGGNFAQSGSGRSNSVVITGAGSTWTNTSTSSIGNFGAFNRLTITNGAVMRNTAGSAALVLGWQSSGSNNVLVVTGTNSLFSNRGSSTGVAVGQGGSFNEMHIRNGGCVDGDTGSMGANNSASNNVAVVADVGSRWLNVFILELGAAGSGNQLWVTNGGWVQAGSLTLGTSLGSSNNLLQVDGGTVSITNAAANSALDIRRGTNVLNGGLIEADILRMTNGVLSRLEVNGGTLSVKSSRVSAGNPLNIGDGVSPATLFLAGNGSHDFTGTPGLIISNNATLTGNGSLLVQLQVRSGATLSPGASIGIISVSTAPILSGTTVMEISKNGSVLTNDQFQVTGTLNYGGSLVVSNFGPTTLTNGDNFKIFDATSYSGSFSSLVLPALGANLTWTNKLLLDGSIEVLSVPPRDFGVDVSHFQGETGVSQSSWNQMFTAGKRFVFIKATEGLTVLDAAMANNVNRATTAGLRAGVYHFAHPELRPTTNGAIQEADYLLSYAGNFVGPGYLRPVLDLEFVAASLSTTDLTDWVIAFANEIIAQRGPGAAPIIYCDQNFANNEFDSRLANYDLWLRTITAIDVSTNEPPSGFPDPTGVFNNWSFWQYSDTGSSGGISPLDLNVCHSEFKTLDSFLIPAVTNPVPPVILTQPQDRAITVSNNATFSVVVTVSSSPPLAYQWRFHGTNLAGANSTSFTRLNSQLTDAGPYTVVITNAGGSVTSVVATLTVTNPPPTAPSKVLYFENFDAYSSPSIVTSPATTNGFKIFFGATGGSFDFSARFGFDYSTITSPTNIPSAPNSTNGTTKGLYLTVNKDATAAAAAVNLYPVGMTFTGTVSLKFDLWINYPNTATATEHALFGINHSANVTNRVGQLTSDGLLFAMDGDGGATSGSATLRDFAVFRGGGSGAIPVLLTNGHPDLGPAPLLGGNFDNADAGFAGLFPSKTLPSFTTTAGTPGNGWVSVEVRQETNMITWLLNNTVVAQYTNTTVFTNGNFLIGYNDNFSSIGGVDNFAIFDNLRVEAPGAFPSPIQLAGLNLALNGAFQFSFTNAPGASFTVLATTNTTLPLSNWTVLGGVTETAPGQFQFTDPQATNNVQRYYRVRWP